METNDIELDEAASKSYDKKVQERLSEKIYDLIDKLEQDKIINFVLASGNNVSLKCVGIKNSTYVFNVEKDDSKAFKKWEILTIELKTGNGENTTEEYGLNKKVVTTQDDGQTFDLLFQAAKKSGVSDKIKINKIKDVNADISEPSNETSTDEPTQEPKDTGEEPEETQSEKSQEQLQVDGEQSLKYILNDPLLQKAFYEQPTLWNIFVSELRGKKPKGKGIITVDGLVKAYDNKKSGVDLKATFIEGKSIYFVPMDVITLKQRNGDSIDLTRDNKNGYETICLGKELAEGPKIKGEIEGYTYILEIIGKLRDEQYGYQCELSVVRQNDDGSEKEIKLGKKRIIIIPNKSEGFVPNKK